MKETVMTCDICRKRIPETDNYWRGYDYQETRDAGDDGLMDDDDDMDLNHICRKCEVVIDNFIKKLVATKGKGK